jgi:hypothetical protein
MCDMQSVHLGFVQAWCTVVLQNRLMDDSRARWPELNAILLSRRFQEIENLLVPLNRLR